MKFEWLQAAIGVIGAFVGALSGLIAGIWRVARIEHEVRKDLSQDIAETEHAIQQKLDEIADRFDETLKALRQKINDVELNTQRSFVAKTDWEDFRREYREDMREIKHSISDLLRTKS